MRPNRTTIVGLIGRAGSGKDSAADHLCARYGFVRASFAEGPRTMLEALLSYTGEDHAFLFEPGKKEQPIPTLQASYRHLMQTLGTDWGRELVDSQLWLRVLARHLGLDTGCPVHDRIVVTDCRYPNEALWLRTEGAHLVGITRRQALAVREHSSEQHAEMLYGQADTLIVNDDSSLASLHQQLDGLMATLQLDTRAPLFIEGA